MKITFRTLEKLIARMTEEQKDEVVMADIIDGINSRTTPAMLAINDDQDHDDMNMDQPYLLIESPDVEVGGVIDDVDRICKRIGL
jgi:hypothetical protein